MGEAMIEQWHVALACVGAVGCFWLGYWAGKSESGPLERDDTEHGVGHIR
jgi:hypothetical protein